MNSLSVVTLAVRFNARVKGVLLRYFIACDGRGENPEHWAPDASTWVLADFSGSCKVQHPSEAVNVKSFGLPLTFYRACACHTLQAKTCHTVF